MMRAAILGSGRRAAAILALAALLAAGLYAGSLAGAGRALGGEAARIEIVDYGIYAHRVDRFEAEPSHVSGQRVIVSGVALLRQATEVDAQLRRLIGFQFRVVDPAMVGETLTLRRLVPPLTNPKTGRTARVIERDIVVPDGNQLFLNAYRFDYEWEMAEGEWRFQVLHKGVVIAEKTIKVVVAMH